jgi:hypothetical protein
MKKVLRYLSLWLLVMAAVPTFGQSDIDQVFTLYEYSFENGKGNWTSSYEVDMMYDPADYPDVWSYNEDLKCMVATFNYAYMFWSLRCPDEINLSDPYYYDITVSVKGFNMSNRQSLKLTVSGETPQYFDILNPDGYTKPTGDEIVFVDCKDINIDALSGKKFQLDLYQTNNSTIPWYVKSIKITAKHKFGKQPFTLARSIAEVKALPELTPVKLINPKVVLLDDFNPRFIRDDTGALMMSDFNTYAYFGTLLSDTIYGLYTRENGVPEIKRTYYYGDPFESGTGNTSPIAISEDQYWNYECNYITMPITEKIFLSNKFGVMFSNYGWYTPHNTNTVVSGFAYPTEDNKKGLIASTGTEPIVVTLSENGNNQFTAEDESYRVKFIVERGFKKDQWYTITLPFGLSNWWVQANCTLAEFVSCENGVLSFKEATTFEAGKPYLIKFNSDQNSFTSTISVSSAVPQTILGGEYNFVGTLNPVQPSDGSYYLSANNTIRPLASGGTINAFRAYFEPASPSVAPARAISIDGEVTAIEDILLPGNSNATIYNLSGQRVNNASKKGLYIQNGKKVVK